MIRHALAGLLLAALCSPAAAAPFRACAVPPEARPAPALPAPRDEIVRDEPVAAYMLALTWSPEWCRTRSNTPGDRFQCRSNHLGFVVHGLWPNGAGARHPRYCGPAPALSVQTLRAHLCMTPSAELLQHEWAAHGTCGWSSPEAYFAKAESLWRGIAAPVLNFPAGKAVTAGDVRQAFVDRNRGLRREGVYIKVAEGNRLMDVRLCYDLQFRPAACRGGVGAPDHARIRIAH